MKIGFRANKNKFNRFVSSNSDDGFHWSFLYDPLLSFNIIYENEQSVIASISTNSRLMDWFVSKVIDSFYSRLTIYFTKKKSEQDKLKSKCWKPERDSERERSNFSLQCFKRPQLPQTCAANQYNWHFHIHFICMLKMASTNKI